MERIMPKTDYTLKPLTQTQRARARDMARASVRRRNGPKPDRAAFSDFTAPKYPPAFTRAVGIGLLIVALASGWISAVRLYQAGYDNAPITLRHEVRVSMGVATPLAAEILVIVATVAAQVYLVGKRRRLSLIPVAVGTIVAFVGNWNMIRPDSAWTWVETMFPPLSVLSVAFIFEVTFVPELERRQSNEVAFQAALGMWQRVESDPEGHEQWQAVYATLLRDALCKVNGISIDQFAPDQWREIVARELDADTWYEGATSRDYAPHNADLDGKQKQQIIRDYVAAHPDAARLSQTALATMLAHELNMPVSQSTVSRALAGTAQRNGHRAGEGA